MTTVHTESALGVLLAAVFFDTDALPSTSSDIATVEDSLVDAVDALDEHWIGLGDDLARAILVLLRDMRHGRLERHGGRVTAAVLRRHVAATIGLASAAPLVHLLGAIAAVPDGDGPHQRALDPAPDPDSAIEIAMAAQVADPGARSGLRRALVDSSLLVPVLELGVEGDAISFQFLPVEVRGMPMISAFTSSERVAEHAAAAGVDAVPLIEVAGTELAMVCPPGHGVAINPGWVVGCVLEEIEVRCLPDAPGLVVPQGELDLSPVVHPAVVGVIDEIRVDGRGRGVRAVHGARRGLDVVLAVEPDADTTPEQAVRRVGAALAERGLEGVVVIPTASPMGRAVVAVAS
ncbi:SseB family protein [Actinospongicola halichondriae]|uniref:SseB family protein n=1 Tax=Actinospongicola halichondriae TaxID=3236844 RepID=UPI003D4E6A1B